MEIRDLLVTIPGPDYKVSLMGLMASIRESYRLFTSRLPSLPMEEFENLIKKHGFRLYIADGLEGNNYYYYVNSKRTMGLMIGKKIWLSSPNDIPGYVKYCCKKYDIDFIPETAFYQYVMDNIHEPNVYIEGIEQAHNVRTLLANEPELIKVENIDDIKAIAPKVSATSVEIAADIDSDYESFINEYNLVAVKEALKQNPYDVASKGDKVMMKTVKFNPGNSQYYMDRMYVDLSKYKSITYHYNDDLFERLNIFITGLESEEAGLFIMKGIPGTGKSSLLMHLITINPIIASKVILMNKNLLLNIDTPDFISFAEEYLKDRILIVEDAEDLVTSRDIQVNPSISGLLNLTSGMLAEIFKLKIIITLNTNNNIDSALLRKGRLKFLYEFGKLTKETAIKLAKKLGRVSNDIKGPMTLADVYNLENENMYTIERPSSIGFQV